MGYSVCVTLVMKILTYARYAAVFIPAKALPKYCLCNHLFVLGEVLLSVKFVCVTLVMKILTYGFHLSAFSLGLLYI